MYALGQYSNKEVAALTNIPEYTIRRQYEKLFNMFEVANKKALGEAYIKILIKGYK